MSVNIFNKSQENLERVAGNIPNSKVVELQNQINVLKDMEVLFDEDVSVGNSTITLSNSSANYRYLIIHISRIGAYRIGMNGYPTIIYEKISDSAYISLRATLNNDKITFANWTYGSNWSVTSERVKVYGIK